MNNCDCREFNEFWKKDLQIHDQNVHEDLSALFLFSSVNYIIWIICDEHHKILKIAFKLKNQNTNRVFTNRMNRIWRKRWNVANVKKKHFDWFIWRSWRAMFWNLFIYEKRVVFLIIHFIVWAIDLIKCDVKTKKKLLFSQKKFFFVILDL
jgi:hypothetical protein